MWWFLGWTVAVLASLALLGWLGYRVVRKGFGLLTALGEVGEQVADVSDSARRAFEARLADSDATSAAADDRDPLTSTAGLR